MPCLFADEAERVFREGGLTAFQSHEADHATRPLPPGPFKPLLEALHRLQQADDRDKVPMRLRTALVTARSAPAHERAIRTLMDWNIHVDEAMFLGGLDKGDVPARVRARLLLRRPDARTSSRRRSTCRRATCRTASRTKSRTMSASRVA